MRAIGALEEVWFGNFTVWGHLEDFKVDYLSAKLSQNHRHTLNNLQYKVEVHDCM